MGPISADSPHTWGPGTCFRACITWFYEKMSYYTAFLEVFDYLLTIHRNHVLYTSPDAPYYKCNVLFRRRHSLSPIAPSSPPPRRKRGEREEWHSKRELVGLKQEVGKLSAGKERRRRHLDAAPQPFLSARGSHSIIFRFRLSFPLFFSFNSPLPTSERSVYRKLQSC